METVLVKEMDLIKKMSQMKIPWKTCYWIVILLLFVTFPATADTFRVGYAMADVTPQVPMPMWGYGARGDALSEGVRDPLHVKTLVIEAGDDRLALVGLDMGRSPMDASMDNIISKVKEVGVGHVFVVGSHTHHGPVIELRDEPGMGRERFDAEVLAYPDFLENSIVGTIREAAENLQEARIGWATQDIDMNRNRHSDFEPRPRDPELAVVRFDDADGEPIAVMVNFAAHPTMHPAEDLRFSAEWPGEMMNAVETAMGTNCFFMQGAIGDLTTRRTPGVEGIEEFGQVLAEKVVTLATGIETSVPEEPGIQAIMKRYEFKSRVPVDNDFLLEMYRQAFFPELVNTKITEFKNSMVRPSLTVALLNNEVAMVGGSGEFFSAHSVRLKKRFRGELSLFFGFCNGHQLYFPTIEGAAEGGYGADPQVAWIEVGASEKMMDDALRILYQMRGDL